MREVALCNRSSGGSQFFAERRDVVFRQVALEYAATKGLDDGCEVGKHGFFSDENERRGVLDERKLLRRGEDLRE